MKSVISALVLATFATPVFADIDLGKAAKDVAIIKNLILPSEEIAGAYAEDYDSSQSERQIKLLTGDDYLNIVSNNYVFADLNGDGRIDLAVAVEAAPNKDPKDGFMTFGARKLEIFFADKAGDLVLAVTGEKVVLDADSGGVWGDPLQGLSVNKKGSLIIDHYGGSADRWAYTQTFGYRGGEFYLIGNGTNYFNSISMVGTETDTNLLTGDQIITKTNGEKEKVIRKKVKVLPLVKLTDAEVGN